MVMVLNGTSGVTFPDNSTQAVGFYGFKNRIINGGMVIDQRNNGASVNIGVSTATSQYTLDRWNFDVSQAPKISVQQSTNAPAGFSNSILVTSLAATSVGASDYFQLNQKIEGFNTSDLAFGTASAATITLSFWVKSTLTGSFSGTLKNSAANRSYPFSYTINSANTWEQKAVTIAGDQSGTWVGGTNGIGINVNFSLGMGSTYSGSANAWASANYGGVTGSVNMVSTNAATWQITGVQLEKGSTATSFDFRDYGTELALCQRYYEVLLSGTAGAGSWSCSTATGSASTLFFWIGDTVPKRASGSAVTSGTWAWNSGSNGTGDFTSFSLRYREGKTLIEASGALTSGTSAYVGYVFPRNNPASLAVSAEL